MSRQYREPKALRFDDHWPEPRALQFDDQPRKTLPVSEPKKLDFGQSALVEAGAKAETATPRPIQFGEQHAEARSQSAVPGRLAFGQPEELRPVQSQAAHAGKPKVLFGDTEHPLLERCFEVARARFPDLYPAHQVRIERAIRQLLPPTLATILTIAELPLQASGEVVETVARVTREFNELDAASLMSKLLETVTRKDGLMDRLLHGKPEEVDYRSALTTVKQALNSFPSRTVELLAKVDRAKVGLVVSLAALGAVGDVIQLPDEPAVEMALRDRRDIVRQAFQQIELLPSQLQRIDEKVVGLLSRADHLMNVTLPAAIAVRSQTG
ncbi:hypothetical protein BYI23_E001770 (plasmid) [Burkholderia sp. YI23]|nr:hypothetical protein BYI23_E001770 [Burkholderia sp. YI23]